MLRAKIHRATITECRLDYEGSIEIDGALMEAAGILENEFVLVANVNNGERFETYVIKAPKNSGTIGLRGAAARLGAVGDKIIVFSIGLLDESELKNFKPQLVYVDEKNKITSAK